jgi:hypothetical protein
MSIAFLHTHTKNAICSWSLSVERCKERDACVSDFFCTQRRIHLCTSSISWRVATTWESHTTMSQIFLTLSDSSLRMERSIDKICKLLLRYFLFLFSWIGLLCFCFVSVRLLFFWLVQRRMNCWSVSRLFFFPFSLRSSFNHRCAFLHAFMIIIVCPRSKEKADHFLIYSFKLWCFLLFYCLWFFFYKMWRKEMWASSSLDILINQEVSF